MLKIYFSDHQCKDSNPGPLAAESILFAEIKFLNST